eukprot:CAMPEP_0170188212 /NCGR_PEP_ID=MMETSP0040_2-20121228/43779_1 /TAXON_ID=641309 /ORGANISM="Lotharella oceanica, Strain CCMP622" /LENGTH=424 /DNA_ID=CAMNT_0010435451 /DNA_START=32 /DNA_END=1306 /DNA_ORIENTATION=+
MQKKGKVDATREGAAIVLQFLQEQGFVSARKALEEESGLKYDEKTQGEHKGNYLLSALAVYKEYLLSKTPESGEVEKERAIEEDLVNPKGGPTKPVSEGKKLAATHGVNIIDVRFSYCTNFQDIVASSDAKGSLVVTDIQSGSSATAVKPGFFKAPILTTDFNPTNNLIAVGCMNGGQYIVDLKAKDKAELLSGAVQPEVVGDLEKHGKYVNRIRWNRDGTLMATCSYDKEVRIYAVTAAQEEAKCELKGRFQFRRGVECVEWGWEHNAHLLYVSLQQDNYVHSIDAKAMKKADRYNMNSFGDDHVSFSALDLHASKDGKYLIACTDKDRIIMFASNSSKQVRNFYGAESGQYFNPRAVLDCNHSNLYATSYDNSIIGWDVGSQRPSAKLKGHSKMIRSLHVHATEPVLVSGSYDRSVRLWTVA